MSIKIDRDFSDDAAKTVTWNRENGCFTHRVPQGEGFASVKVEQPFVMDVWQAQHGYQVLVKDQPRETMLASVGDPLPEKPAGGKKCFIVPVYSPEVGFRAELVIQGMACTEALANLFDQLKEDEAASDAVPLIAVSQTTTDYGLAPTFQVIDWKPRKAAFGKTLFDRLA